jgi:hypothetical protein
MLAGIPAATVALSSDPASATGTVADDPVFAAIARHRQAVQALLTAMDAANIRYDEAAEAARDDAGDAVGDAFTDWVTTQPTTMGGVLATLDYAASISLIDDDRTVLAYYDLPIEGCSDFEPAKFPAMIAAALRQIRG